MRSILMVVAVAVAVAPAASFGQTPAGTSAPRGMIQAGPALGQSDALTRMGLPGTGPSRFIVLVSGGARVAKRLTIGGELFRPASAKGSYFGAGGTPDEIENELSVSLTATVAVIGSGAAGLEIVGGAGGIRVQRGGSSIIGPAYLAGVNLPLAVGPHAALVPFARLYSLQRRDVAGIRGFASRRFLAGGALRVMW
jgi:hypothetical protein